MYQKLIIIGNVGREIEMRYTPDGTPVANINIATNRKWNNADGTKGEETTWFRVTCWNRTAEIAAQYLSKGHQVMIEGTLTPDKDTGSPRTFVRQDGTAAASYEVRCAHLVLLDNRGNAAPPNSTFDETAGNGNIPF